MSNKVLKASLVAGILVATGAAYTSQATDEPELGPLPALETDAAKAKLGKRLFFDPRLSGDAAISCASCHKPENGFANDQALSPGYPGNGHFRNTPTVINAVHKKSWFHDGRIGTNLNDVTREMITEDYIMNMDMRLMQERIKQDPLYVRMFEDAGFGEPSNGGVPENLDIFRDPENHQAFIAFNMFRGNGHYMALKRDVEAHVRLHKADRSDVGQFMTPSLRELKYTAPYRHNGAFYTLEEVVDFYNAGGVAEDGRTTDFPGSKSPLIQPLNLSDEEKEDLVSFLEAFLGDEMLMDKPELPPYAPLFTEAELLLEVKK